MTRYFRYLLVLVVIATGCMAFNAGAQTIRNNNHSTVGYIRSDGRIENSNHSCLGYVRNDGRVENSNHSCLGYVEGMSREWAAAFFFFFF